MRKRRQAQYWAYSDNIYDALRNGSFLRKAKGFDAYAQYINGDYMGSVTILPNGFTEVPQEQAENLIPEVCL